MEGGGLAGLLVHVDAGLLQQLVGDQLMVEHNRDAEGGVLDTVDWKYIIISLKIFGNGGFRKVSRQNERKDNV